MTLFDEGCFRKTKKSALYDDFPLCSDSVDIKTCYTVVDGGFLLHRVKWNGGAPFSSILAIIERREELNRIRNKTTSEKVEHCELRKLAKKKIKEDLHNHELQIINKFLESTGSTKRITKEISEVKKNWILKLANKQGIIKTERNEIAEIATLFYEELYNDIDIPSEATVITPTKDLRNTHSILRSEIEWGIKQLKKEKAPGDDKITNELLIHGNVPELQKELQILFTRILTEAAIPTQWITSSYEDFSRTLLTHFKNSGINFVKCNTLLIDVTDENQQLDIIKSQHESLTNHRGIDETTKSIKQNYYWPNLVNTVQNYINNYEICQITKYDRKPLKLYMNKTPTATRPFEIVHIDTFTAERTKLLTIVDSFSKLAQAYYLES
ncbi:hypothetical protein WDU94_015550 [Cyamophila willieti]